MSDLAPFRDAFRSLAERLIAFLPNLAVAILVVAIGWLISRVLAAGARRLAQRLKFDAVMADAGWSNALGQAGVRAKPSDMVGRLVFWILMVIVLILSAQNLGLELSALPLRGFVAYLPQVLGAVLLLFVGSTVAAILGTAVNTALARIHFAQHSLLAGAVRGLTLVVTFVAAFQHLGFEIDFLTQTLVNLVTIFAAALAITFALGGREAAHNILAGYYAREHFKAGDRLQIDSEEGELLGIGTLTAELRTETGDLVIPNSRLTDQTVKRLEER